MGGLSQEAGQQGEPGEGNGADGRRAGGAQAGGSGELRMEKCPEKDGKKRKGKRGNGERKGGDGGGDAAGEGEHAESRETAPKAVQGGVRESIAHRQHGQHRLSALGRWLANLGSIFMWSFYVDLRSIFKSFFVHIRPLTSLSRGNQRIWRCCSAALQLTVTIPEGKRSFFCFFFFG